jgi:diketogulonate reductase-like aldo/keto reductase
MANTATAPSLMDNEVVTALAKKYNKSPAAV